MKLSEFELEVMQLLWEAQEASAPELHERVQISRDVTYSTVKTIVDRLEAKGAIARSRQAGRTIFYTPLLAQDKYTKPLVKRFLDNVFGGESTTLFNHLLSDEKLKEADIEYLEKLLEAKKAELRKKK